MNAPASSSRQIAWPSVITVISAAILIGAEVFGAAFAGGWALAILFGLGDQGAHEISSILTRQRPKLQLAQRNLAPKPGQPGGKRDTRARIAVN